MRAAGKHLRGSQLREVFLSGVEVRESSGTPGLEHSLLAALTTNLHHLTLLSLAGLKLSPTQAAVFGKVRLVWLLFWCSGKIAVCCVHLVSTAVICIALQNLVSEC